MPDAVNLPRAGKLGVTTRLSRDDDEDLETLFQVYADSREDLDRAVWDSPAEKETFLRQQFMFQDVQYRAHYPNRQFLIIEHGGEAVGRLYLDETKRDIRVMDIAFFRLHRGKGWGGAIMRDILDYGTETIREVSIHVEKRNRALNLYRRLGFTYEPELGLDDGMYDFMVWVPPMMAGAGKCSN